MNEKLAKKLSKILAKAGLEEDKIEGILEDVEEALAEEGAPEGDNPDENQLPPSEEEGNENPVEEGEGELPPEGELPVPPSEDDVPPADELPPQEGDGSIEDALSQLAAQEEGAPVPPQPQEEVQTAVEPPVPQVPAVDPSVIGELQNQLGEANKTIEALKAQIDSLFNSLKEAGVISGGQSIGDETPRVTPSSSAENDDAFDDILATINGR